MELIEEKQKMLVKYLREKDKYTAKVCSNKYGVVYPYLKIEKGKIIGCIIAVNRNVIGWSLINKLDRQWLKWDWLIKNSKEQKELLDKNKSIAFKIAYNRAMVAEGFDSDSLIEYYLNIPDSILNEVDKLNERSEKYFK